MEFPELGGHCHVKTCNMLDFLPMKCDVCSNIFCKDHFSYSNHSCNNAYQKNVQVPVCPLCNKPVPSKRGEQPDIAVGEHIDRDCQADPAISKRKIYTNKCNVKGCKQKEVLRITCDSCLKSYCLKHRHPVDHKCQEQKPPAPSQAAGAAAIARAQVNNKFKFPWQTNRSCANSVEKKRSSAPMPEVSVTSVQGRLSEDEALAIAIQNSMKETKPRNMQEEEDRLLAQALANSEMERVGGSPQHRNPAFSCFSVNFLESPKVPSLSFSNDYKVMEMSVNVAVQIAVELQHRMTADRTCVIHAWSTSFNPPTTPHNVYWIFREHCLLSETPYVSSK